MNQYIASVESKVSYHAFMYVRLFTHQINDNNIMTLLAQALTNMHHFIQNINFSDFFKYRADTTTENTPRPPVEVKPEDETCKHY